MHRLPSIDTSRLTYLLLYELKLFAPARVNGQSTFAYLDTGANQITVSPQVAGDGPRTGSMAIRGAFGQEEFERTAVDVEFLGHARRSVQARIHEGQAELPFDSALTLDAPTLFAQPIVLDFRLIAIYRPGPERTENGWAEVPGQFTAQGLCLVQGTSPEGRPIWALFDTGAGLSVMNARHLDANGLALSPAYTIEIKDATGAKSIQEVALCSGLRLHGLSLPPFDGFATDLQGIEEALGHRIDVILGANAMLKSGLRWRFDPQAGQVRVAP